MNDVQKRAKATLTAINCDPLWQHLFERLSQGQPAGTVHSSLAEAYGHSTVVLDQCGHVLSCVFAFDPGRYPLRPEYLQGSICFFLAS